MQMKGSRFGAEQAAISFTDRPVSGWGGLALIGRFFDAFDLGDWMERALPDGRTSPNQTTIRDLASTLFAIVLTGGSRFAHGERLRQDEVVRTALRMTKVPSPVSLTRYFGGFRQRDVEHLTDVLWPLWTRRARVPDEGGILDLDSTIFERFGRQEGSLKGHNPRRHGRPSHHPLLAMLANTKQIAHVWLRSGNSGTARGVNGFLAETLARISPLTIRAVRCDSGFFIASFLAELESRDLDYAVAVRANPHVRRIALGISDWRVFGRGLEVGEIAYQAPGWKLPRRLVVIREELEERPDSRGRRLFEVPLYTFHFVMTSLELPGEDVWRFYNERAECENRLKELKNDYGANRFCLRSFFGTEAVLRLICLLYNLIADFKREITEKPSAQLATVRNEVLVVGAIRGTEGRKIVLRLGARASARTRIERLLDRLEAFIPTAAQFVKSLEEQLIPPPGRWRLRPRPRPSTALSYLPAHA